MAKSRPPLATAHDTTVDLLGPASGMPAALAAYDATPLCPALRLCPDRGRASGRQRRNRTVTG